MPTKTPLTDQVVTVVFHPGEDADWFTASEKVHDLLAAHGTLTRRYRIRHRRIFGWATRWLDYHLLDAARTRGAVTTAAGGRKRRLDLNGAAAKAASDATRRWRTWHTRIASTTPPARTWQDYLAQHHADPAKVSLAEARRRFDQQPRVLAMLAHCGSGHTFDPYELAAYQAGEATYAGLYWRTAIVGDALITADGKAMQPASDSLADRLRFLNDAIGYLHRLKPDARLCAVAIA